MFQFAVFICFAKELQFFERCLETIATYYSELHPSPIRCEGFENPLLSQDYETYLSYELKVSARKIKGI